MQDKLFVCDDPNRKVELKAELQSLKDMIVDEQLQYCSKEIKEAYAQAIKKTSKPFTLWHLDFARVFRDNGGFDIVIGNPPYVDSEEMTKNLPLEREMYAKKFKCAKGNWDLYIPFWENGFNLLNENGNISLITPNKWLAIKYGAALREFITPYLYNINDYSDFYAFESADVSTVVAMAQKRICDTITATKFDDIYTIIKNKIVNKEVIAPFDNLSLCLSDNFDTLYSIL